MINLSDDRLKMKVVDYIGTPGRIRTCGLRIRSPALYPAELRAQKETLVEIIAFLELEQNWMLFKGFLKNGVSEGD